jgi:hypothetical protein
MKTLRCPQHTDEQRTTLRAQHGLICMISCTSLTGNVLNQQIHFIAHVQMSAQ